MTDLYNLFSKIPVFGQILTGASLGIKVAEGAATQTGKKLADQILNKVGLDSKEAKLLKQININLQEFSELMSEKLTQEEKEELVKIVNVYNQSAEKIYNIENAQGSTFN
jgi:hypothetical protein